MWLKKLFIGITSEVLRAVYITLFNDFTPIQMLKRCYDEQTISDAALLRADSNCVDVGVRGIYSEMLRLAPPEHLALSRSRTLSETDYFSQTSNPERALSDSAGEVSFQHVLAAPV